MDENERNERNEIIWNICITMSSMNVERNDTTKVYTNYKERLTVTVFQ